MEKMGIVLGVEAAVGIAEAVEVAAESGEIIADIAETEEAIDAGITAGSEAGAEAGGEAAAGVEAGATALEEVIAKFTEAIGKVTKMVGEYLAIDAAFRGAKVILSGSPSGSPESDRERKLGKLIDVLNNSADLMTRLSSFLEQNGTDTVHIKDYTVTLQGVLSKYVSKLGSVSS